MRASRVLRHRAQMKTPDARCTCLGGPNDVYEGDPEACIAGTVYGLCESEFCGGVCDSQGACDCPLHESITHDSGFGGIWHA